METRETMQKGRESLSADLEDRLRGVNFPLERSDAEERLRGASVEGRDITSYFDNIDWPVNSRDDLVSKIRSASGRGASESSESSSGTPGLQ